jgi:cobalamin biosynthesis Mg chelatase CobN
MDPKQIVAQGYDAIAGRYAEWTSLTRTDERERYIALLLSALPPHRALSSVEVPRP